MYNKHKDEEIKLRTLIHKLITFNRLYIFFCSIMSFLVASDQNILRAWA